MTKSYGAWVSKKEVIPVEDYEAHEDVAIQIIEKELKNRNCHLQPKKYSIYRVMLKLGYIRLLYNKNSDGYSVNYYFKGKFSRFQKEIIAEASFKEVNFIYARHMPKVDEMNRRLFND